MVEAELRAERPRYVVVVQSILTFATAQDTDGSFIFARKKTRRNIVTILTGSHATNYPGRAVSEGICNYFLKGEIENSLPSLILLLEQGA